MISNKSGAILSIDYGERYFGFAIKLKNEDTSFALDVLDSKKEDEFKQILKYYKKYEVDNIIVGYPLGLTGRKTRMTDLVDEFIHKLEVIGNINITPIDERFTSKIPINDDKKRLDSLSAMLLLDTFIKDNE